MQKIKYQFCSINLILVDVFSFSLILQSLNLGFLKRGFILFENP